MAVPAVHNPQLLSGHRMDPTTVCIFRLFDLMESRHQYYRNLDANTRKTVTLLVEATTRPPSLSFDFEQYTKEDLKVDLEYLAETMVKRAFRSHNFSLEDIATTVSKAVTDALPPLPPDPAIAAKARHQNLLNAIKKGISIYDKDGCRKFYAKDRNLYPWVDRYRYEQAV
jgi:hypothetical protein